MDNLKAGTEIIKSNIEKQITLFETEFSNTMRELVQHNQVLADKQKNTRISNDGIGDYVESYALFQVLLDSFETESKSAVKRFESTLDDFNEKLKKAQDDFQKLVDSVKSSTQAPIVINEEPEKQPQDIDMVRSIMFSRQQPKQDQVLKEDAMLKANIDLHNIDVSIGQLEVTQFADPSILAIFHDILQKHQGAKKTYINPEFPHDLRSVAYDIQSFQKALQYVWRRLDGELIHNVSLFGQDLRPEHIKQGALGDCYLLTCLSVLSEKPNLIRRLFFPQELSKEGMYAITLCDSGEWKTLVIDNVVPCRDAMHGPAFSRNGDNGQWVALMEKAYAKMFGSYQAIESGTSLTAFRALTGAPTEYYDLKAQEIAGNTEIIWSYLTAMLDNGFLLTASSIREIDNNSIHDLKSKGIIGSHSYSVLDAKQIDLGNGTTERLVKLRNPWGNKQWTGAWSDGSNNWNDYTLRQANHYKNNKNGIFWMTVSDLQKNFCDLVTCKCHATYKYSYIKVSQKRSFPDNLSMIQVSVKNTTNIYLSVVQKEQRHFLQKVNTMEYKYSLMRVWLVDSKTKNLKDSEFKWDPNTGAIDLELNLKAGEYLLFIETYWNQSYYNDFTVTSYSDLDVDLKDVTANYHNKWRAFMDGVICAYTESKINSNKKHKSTFKTIIYDNLGAPDVVKYVNTRIKGLIIFHYRNYSDDKHLKEDIHMSCDVPDAMALCGPDKEDTPGKFVVNLPPLGEKIVIYKLVKKETMQWKYSTKSKLRFNHSFY